MSDLVRGSSEQLQVSELVVPVFFPMSGQKQAAGVLRALMGLINPDQPALRPLWAQGLNSLLAGSVSVRCWSFTLGLSYVVAIFVLSLVTVACGYRCCCCRLQHTG